MYFKNLNKSFYIGIPIGIITLSNGIYESWQYLNEYELQKENYKTTTRKIEKATIGFGIGLINGFALSIFSPFIFTGATIAYTHSFLKK